MESKCYFALKKFRVKKLNDKESLYIPTHFKTPSLFKKKQKLSPFLKDSKNPYLYFTHASHLKNYCILGLGGNKGNVLETFYKLFFRIQKKNAIIHKSIFYKNPPFGYTQQDDFYNAILWLKTQKSLAEFFAYTAYLERIFGRARKRDFKNAPRTLDIDIVGFKNKKIVLKHLQIPHKEWIKRESVKIPLLWGENETSNLQG